MENSIFFNKIGDYVSKGDRIAELYHGERDDILKLLSKIVGEKGIVYGVDELNPFRRHKHMRALRKVPNIKLIKSKIPPLPSEVKDLDAIIIREFHYTNERNGVSKDGVVKYKENPEAYVAIDSALNNNAYLILHLNSTEQKNENGGKKSYQKTIKRNFPDFKKEFHEGNILVYQKLK
jgi:hypothetical protein